MDLLIAVLMMLGVNCGPDNLNDSRFLEENKMQIEKATEMINKGDITPEMLQKGGVVIVDEGNTKN